MNNNFNSGNPLLTKVILLFGASVAIVGALLGRSNRPVQNQARQQLTAREVYTSLSSEIPAATKVTDSRDLIAIRSFLLPTVFTMIALKSFQNEYREKMRTELANNFNTQLEKYTLEVTFLEGQQAPSDEFSELIEKLKAWSQTMQNIRNRVKSSLFRFRSSSNYVEQTRHVADFRSIEGMIITIISDIERLEFIARDTDRMIVKNRLKKLISIVKEISKTNDKLKNNLWNFF